MTTLPQLGGTVLRSVVVDPRTAKRKPIAGRYRTEYYYDVDNRIGIVPGFARFPVNDRMIVGPRHAVKVWSHTTIPIT